MNNISNTSLLLDNYSNGGGVRKYLNISDLNKYNPHTSHFYKERRYMDLL